MATTHPTPHTQVETRAQRPWVLVTRDDHAGAVLVEVFSDDRMPRCVQREVFLFEAHDGPGAAVDAAVEWARAQGHPVEDRSHSGSSWRDADHEADGLAREHAEAVVDAHAAVREGWW